jgi:quercetin dioxygenase-like cupin family protein
MMLGWGVALPCTIKPFMQMTQIPFGTTDWAGVPVERKNGVTGWADWKVRQFGDVRVRLLEYSPGYRADHWCTKGHILFCLEGELITELDDGREFVLRPGMSYQVADGAEPHRSHTAIGAKLFVVD